MKGGEEEDEEWAVEEAEEKEESEEEEGREREGEGGRACGREGLMAERTSLRSKKNE